MNEYERTGFQRTYTGEPLTKITEMINAPWEIGEAQPLVREILKKSQPGRLLDVGCGLGFNAEAAADLGFEVVAIDASRQFIEKCQEKFSASDITFLVSDATNTNLEPGFNTVLDSTTYHAIPLSQRLMYLAEMRRLVSKNTLFHIIAFSPAANGMPKPLAAELSEISKNLESTGWEVLFVEKREYNGNAFALKEFQKTHNSKIKIDQKGRTRLPVWHVISGPVQGCIDAKAISG